ncbi:MAG: YWFCY domain-containing protein, partial [Chitinophagaceae bacterium]|nr:YWFCY domain-containing protein [Chitinophagaceae bacterium]
MAGTGENEVGLRKIVDFTRLGSIVLLLIHFYYSCYGCFAYWELRSDFSDRFLQNISRTGLLDTAVKSKLLALALLVISLLGSKGKKDEKISATTIILYQLTGILLYFGSIVLLQSKSDLLTVGISYMILSGTGFLLILSGGTMLSRYIKLNLGKDIFNELNETFPQEERLLENEYSINLPAQ